MFQDIENRYLGHPEVRTSADHIQRIKDTIRKLQAEHDKVIRRLHQELVAPLRERNEKLALTKDVPPEVLSTIFQYACTPERREPVLNVLTLGHVSSRWRKVAWSNPKLWETFSPPTKHRTVSSVLNFVQVNLYNWNKLPFPLPLSLPENLSSEDELDNSGLWELLSDVENAEKIQSLSSTDPPQRLLSLISEGRFSQLKELDLSGCNQSMELSPTSLGPKLRQLSLSRLNPVVSVANSWPITSLTLTGIPHNTCISIFLNCPAVIEAHILNPIDPTPNSTPSELPWDPESTTIILFPNLQILSWSCGTDPDYQTLFKHIKTPSLRDLRIGYDGVRDECPADTVLANLADNFPSRITHLSLERLSFFPKWFFIRVFSLTKHLQSLTLIRCDPFSITSIPSALYDPQHGQTSSLPLLKELTFHGGLVKALLFPTWPSRICDFIEAQWRHGIPHFRLRLHGPPQPRDWNAAAVDRKFVKVRVQGGFKLDILNDGRQAIDWTAEMNKRMGIVKS